MSLSDGLKLEASKDGFVCLYCFATASDVSGAHAKNSTDDGQDLPSMNAINSPFVPNGDFQWVI